MISYLPLSMKSLLTILIIFLGVAVNAQSLSKDILKGTQAIIIKNSNTASENFKVAGDALISLDYELGQVHKDFGTIQTKIFKTNDPIGTAHLQVIDIVAKDSLVKITSRYQPLDGDNKNQLIEGVTPMYKPVVFKKKVFGSYGIFQAPLNVAGKIKGEIWYSK